MEVIELNFKKLSETVSAAVAVGREDFSGRYVREADYTKLLERHRRLFLAAKQCMNMEYKKGTPISIWNALCEQARTELKAALAEEVDDGCDKT